MQKKVVVGVLVSIVVIFGACLFMILSKLDERARMSEIYSIDRPAATVWVYTIDECMKTGKDLETCKQENPIEHFKKLAEIYVTMNADSIKHRLSTLNK